MQRNDPRTSVGNKQIHPKVLTNGQYAEKWRTRLNILAEVTAADDLTRDWPKVELLKALGFRLGVTKNLCETLWEDRESVPLAEIFELLVSSDRDPRPGYLICRILDFRSVGRKGFLELASNLSRMDFGPRCNSAWQEKYQQLMKAHRLKGLSNYSWSFPVTEEGKLMARFMGGTPCPPKRRRRF